MSYPLFCFYTAAFYATLKKIPARSALKKTELLLPDCRYTLFQSFYLTFRIGFFLPFFF